jgi:hypothetical protein
MDSEEAKQYVTEVSVSSSETKQIEQYEPSEASVGFTAEVPADEDPQAVQEALSELAREQARSEILERWEAHLRKEMDED